MVRARGNERRESVRASGGAEDARRGSGRDGGGERTERTIKIKRNVSGKGGRRKGRRESGEGRKIKRGEEGCKMHTARLAAPSPVGIRGQKGAKRDAREEEDARKAGGKTGKGKLQSFGVFAKAV